MGKDLNGKKLPKGITQLKNGLYQGRVTYGGQTEAIYSHSIADLKNKLTDLRHSLQHGTFVKESHMTVDDWFKEWIEVYKKPVVKRGTVESYQKHYNAYIKNQIGNIKLCDVRGEHLQKTLNRMKDEGYHDATIELSFCVLSGMFKQAYKNEMISKNPFSVITRPKGKEKEEKTVFTVEQQNLFMEYSDRYYLKNYLKLAICTGMRCGEIGGLQWRDIDFRAKIIHVRHTLKDDCKIDTAKTKTSIRDIPMIGQAEAILRDEEKTYKEMTKGKPLKLDNDDFVFSVDGNPVSRKRVMFIIDTMLADMKADGIDFPYFRFHTTRHTFATRCLENGMNPQVLKAILGHATFSVTMDLYGHVLDNVKQDEMEKVAEAFNVKKAQ